MRFAELAIFTDNVESTAAFYERLLGVAPKHRGEGIAIFKVGGVDLLIHKTYEPGPGDLPCENHVAFAVPDVDRAVAGLQDKGLTVDIPPADYPWGRSAYLRDPDGNLVEVQDAAKTSENDEEL